MGHLEQQAAAGSVSRLERALAENAGAPSRLGEELTRLGGSDPEFVPSVLKVVREGERGAGLRYLAGWLLESGLLGELLAKRLESSEAEALLRGLMRIEPFFEVRLLRWLMKERESEAIRRLGPGLEQLVILIDRVSPGNRLLPLTVQLLRLEDGRIRSKSALMLAQRNGRAEWALKESDPRVRANAVEALWGKDTPKVRHLLREYSKDPNNRVSGNALLALHRLREAGAFDEIVRMSRHPQEAFRATAAWVMGQTGDPRFLAPLEALAKDPDERVRANAAASIPKVTPTAKVQYRRLEISILHARDAGSHLRLWAAVSGLEGEVLSVVAEAAPGERLEAQARRVAPEAVDVAFLLPKRCYLPAEAVGLLEAAVRKFYSSKREADRGMVLRYGDGPACAEAACASPAGYQRIRGLALEPPRTPGPPVRGRPARFNAVHSSAFEPEAPSLEEALRAALAAETRMQAAVNVVAVAGAHTGEFQLPLPGSTQDAFVHVILAPGAPPGAREALAGLAEGSRGALLEASNWKEVPELMNTLRLGLIDGYEILLPGDGSVAERRLKLSVSQPGARGETAAVLTRTGSGGWICRAAEVPAQ
mgnify:CR=1 FL=1